MEAEDEEHRDEDTVERPPLFSTFENKQGYRSIKYKLLKYFENLRNNYVQKETIKMKNEKIYINQEKNTKIKTKVKEYNDFNICCSKNNFKFKFKVIDK